MQVFNESFYLFYSFRKYKSNTFLSFHPFHLSLIKTSVEVGRISTELKLNKWPINWRETVDLCSVYGILHKEIEPNNSGLRKYL